MVSGVDHYQSEAGFHCIRLHYTADPDKDPVNVTGSQWLEAELKGYPGGMGSNQWRREMEIDWEATGGDLVFPQFTVYRSKIVIPPFEVPETWTLYATFDYGHRNPSAFHIHALDYDSNPWTIWEFYASGMTVRQIAKAIHRCPYYEKLAYPPIADPSIWAMDQQTEVEVKSIARLFLELGDEDAVYFAKGSKGGDIAAAEMVNGEFWFDLKNIGPRWKIFPTCPMLIWELKRLRYAEWSGTQGILRNEQEKIVDKDNHAWDGWKMFCNMFFRGSAQPEKDKNAKLKAIDPESWKEWERVRERLAVKQNAGIGDETCDW